MDILNVPCTKACEWDKYLEPYSEQISNRWKHFQGKVRQLTKNETILDFSNPNNYGIYIMQGPQIFQLLEIDQIDQEGQFPYLIYREWVGNAKFISIMGDFNNWNDSQYKSLTQNFGVHEIRIPFIKKDNKYICPIQNGSTYKIRIQTHQDKIMFKHPLHCLYSQLNKKKGMLDPIFFSSNKFVFKAPRPLHEHLRIYETHIGMSTEEEKINSFVEFTTEMLPKIKDKGYNALQIMAIQEHSYYGSFGYQVTSFFAPSSRYGTPQEFQQLVERAHELGLMIFLDLVHSHASKNEEDGVANYDGSKFLFHEKDHPLWDSKVFDYEHPETLRFLTQNLRFWLDQFNIDGFRFDGCMSMMYWHRSAGVGYTGRYGEYFDKDAGVDVGAVTYLRIAHMIFEIYRQNGRKVTTIAEDVSGYPGLAASLYDGGVGFDYRFQMAVPDLWIQLMKKGFDEGLNDANVEVGKIRYALTNRRYQEKHIVYCECHDQSLVGDKTLLMWLLNEKIYSDMGIFAGQSARAVRGIAIHKLIRLLTCGLGGEGYLAFMGNEFGHPEWIDFPRPENGYSYKMCRRQWHLEKATRYADLGEYDKALMRQCERLSWYGTNEYVVREDEGRKLILFDRGCAYFIVSLYWADQEVVCPLRQPGTYKVVLDSEEFTFSGSGSELKNTEFHSIEYSKLSEQQQKQLHGFKDCIIVQLRARHGLLLEKIK